jgi:uncharacterized membrane protein
VHGFTERADGAAQLGAAPDLEPQLAASHVRYYCACGSKPVSLGPLGVEMTDMARRSWIVLPLALLQGVTSFAPLALSSEAESIARHAINSATRAPLQIQSLWVLLALAALPLVVAVHGVARRSPLDRVLTLLFAVLLIVILVASAQVSAPGGSGMSM